MEQVLVVRSADLEQYLGDAPFMVEELADILPFILKTHSFAERDAAEYDTSLKQIIPYVIIRQAERIFLLRRLKRQTETRLHDRLSIGIGGHINPGEARGEASILEAGMLRELEEEVQVGHIDSLRCVGVLHDRTDGVSEYHLGLVYLLETKDDVAVREIEKMEGSWATLAELEASYDQLETWSQLALRYYLRTLMASTA